MKKIVSLTLVLLMLMSTCVFAEETQLKTTLKVVFDGQEIVFPDEQPFTNIETKMPDKTTYKATDNRIVFVPIRAISEAVGYEVLWDNDTETVTVQKGDRVTTFKLGGNCYVNGKTAQCIVNFPMKNDRVFVSQYGICHALNCTMRWDDVNRVLYLFSKEKYPEGADLTQVKYFDEVKKHDILGEFNSMSEPAFVFPGLQEGFVPQGVAYRKDKNQFLVSGYNDISYSYIAVINGETGKMISYFRPLKLDGTVHTGHMGGIATDDKNIYIANGQNIEIISLETLDATKSGDYLKVERSIRLNTVSAGNSFVEVSDGYMWMGNYYQPEKKQYSKKAFEEYPVVIRGYKLDSAQPDGLALEYKVENDNYDYIPAVMYTLEDDQHIQGMTTAGNYLITAVSDGKIQSKIRIYDINKSEGISGTVKMGDNTDIPLVHLKLEKTLEAPSYIEEVAVVNGYLYTTSEGAVQKFRGGKNVYFTDCAWKTDLSKLLAPHAE